MFLNRSNYQAIEENRKTATHTHTTEEHLLHNFDNPVAQVNVPTLETNRIAFRLLRAERPQTTQDACLEISAKETINTLEIIIKKHVGGEVELASFYLGTGKSYCNDVHCIVTP